MGFKCPYCLQDFGTDKEGWKKHLKTEHDGLGNDIAHAITNTYKNLEV